METPLGFSASFCFPYNLKVYQHAPLLFLMETPTKHKNQQINKTKGLRNNLKRIKASNCNTITPYLATLCVTSYLGSKELNYLLQKWVPPSLIIAQGVSNLVKTFSFRNLNTTSASLVGNAHVSM